MNMGTGNGPITITVVHFTLVKKIDRSEKNNYGNLFVLAFKPTSSWHVGHLIWLEATLVTLNFTLTFVEG